MHTPDCEGYVRLDDNKRYMALKSGLLCYYNSDNVSISTPHSSFHDDQCIHNDYIGRVNEYPTMHYIGIPAHTQSMIAYILTEYSWKFQ